LAKVLRVSRQAEVRLGAVWAACRIAGPAARAVVRAGLDDPDATVRQAALHATGLWRDRNATPRLRALLSSADAAHRRAAAEAIGRVGAKEAVPELLAAAGQPADRMLEHALTFALIEIADRPATQAALDDTNARTRRAAMIALDQMPDGGLDPERVVAGLRSGDTALREAAWWVAGRHPDWGATLKPALRDALADGDLADDDRQALERLLVRYTANEVVRGWLAVLVLDPAVPTPGRRLILRALAQAQSKEVPSVWTSAVARVLACGDMDLVVEAVATARAWRLSADRAGELAERLRAVVEDERLPAKVRLQGLAAIPGGMPEVSPPLFAFLVGALDVGRPPPLRALAAEAMATARLRPDQLRALAACLRTTGPLERRRLLPGFRKAPDDVGRALLAALGSPAPVPGLRPDEIEGLFATSAPDVRAEAARLVAALRSSAEGPAQQIERLLPLVHRGDPRRGKEVFFGNKAACSSCHKIAYLGGSAGPALTNIGALRADQDLLESILVPRATIVQGYESWAALTKDGQVFSGLLLRESSEVVVLATGADQTVRLLRGEIEELRPSSGSLMPEGIGQVLEPTELADLVAFLKSCR
jgi:putative heme-binding domain-containing protein